MENRKFDLNGELNRIVASQMVGFDECVKRVRENQNKEDAIKNKETNFLRLKAGAKKELYFSTDIETDGPVPGEYSMLSFASVVFTAEGVEVGYFSSNLDLLPPAKQSPETMEFWAKNPEKFQETRVDLESPYDAMERYVRWVKSFGGMPVFVAYPAGFDFMFMYWYMIKFAGESPFSFSALDIKSYAAAVLKKPYRMVTKRSMPKHWFSKLPHTHNALDDAREQGQLFINILKENCLT